MVLKQALAREAKRHKHSQVLEQETWICNTYEENNSVISCVADIKCRAYAGTLYQAVTVPPFATGISMALVISSS
jgi:hypothetical protein